MWSIKYSSVHFPNGRQTIEDHFQWKEGIALEESIFKRMIFSEKNKIYKNIFIKKGIFIHVLYEAKSENLWKIFVNNYFKIGVSKLELSVQFMVFRSFAREKILSDLMMSLWCIIESWRDRCEGDRDEKSLSLRLQNNSKEKMLTIPWFLWRSKIKFQRSFAF